MPKSVPKQKFVNGPLHLYILWTVKESLHILCLFLCVCFFSFWIYPLYSWKKNNKTHRCMKNIELLTFKVWWGGFPIQGSAVLFVGVFLTVQVWMREYKCAVFFITELLYLDQIQCLLIRWSVFITVITRNSYLNSFP